jgi:carbamoyltransferase
MEYVLGISCYFHDAAAVLLRDGELVAAAEEERFSRIKHDYSYPQQAIQFCLDQAGIEGGDLAQVVFFEKPFVKFDRLLRTSVEAWPRSYSLFVQSMRTWLFDKLWIRARIEEELRVPASRILFSDHHISHAASAYYASPFEEAAVLTIDGVGEWNTATLGVARGHELTITDEMRFPHSLGLLYSAFTAFLGFEVNEGEYKVMGMAPYGRPNYVDRVMKTLRVYEDGSLWLDPAYYSFHHATRFPITNKFLRLFGEPRPAELPFFTEGTGFPDYYGDRPADSDPQWERNQFYADIAASIQTVAEEAMLSMAREAHRRTGLTRLAMAGGVALNSVGNNRILRETPIEELYVQPAAGDSGGALGGALWAWHHAMGHRERHVMSHAYWGAAQSEEAIETALRATPGIRYRRETDAGTIASTVDALAAGRVVGWAQGRFEWGPRSLGNRSILADPRRAEMKDIVNEKIKFREPFRPFAPSVPVDEASKFFDLPDAAASYPARFMLQVVPVLESAADAVPAVNHLGTARVQTIHPDTNPRYHQLASAFGEATGTPVLLNTSFNVRGEPIVNTPAECIATFQKSGIDTLVLGNWIAEKDEESR